MPRAARSIIRGFVYHLISRFVDREWFITHERERKHYLSLLGRAIQKSDWQCIGYAVMSNHLHVAVVAGQESLSSWIRCVNSPFANFMNTEHDRIGPLFVRGPRALETPAQDVARLIAYVHNNPVRANVVPNAADSTWTSHRAYLGLDRAPPWLNVKLGLERCGFSDPRAFDEFVRLHPKDPAREALERDTPDVDESALFRDALVARPIARDERPSATAIVEATASQVGLPVSSIRSRRKGAEESLAREVAVHCASSLGVTGVAIADALALSQSGASLALRRAATRREVLELSAKVAMRLSDTATHTSHV